MLKEGVQIEKIDYQYVSPQGISYKHHKPIFTVVVGSYNYNLQVQKALSDRVEDKAIVSDKDRKIFVFPTFDELYRREMFRRQTVDTDKDEDIHDIRHLDSLLWNANPSFLEMLYSSEITLYTLDALPLFEMREDLATINLAFFYHACKGLFFRAMGLLEKGTQWTRPLVEKFGYDTKQALTAIRCLDVCERFYRNDFTNYAAAMRYSNEEREEMLAFKRGKFTLPEFKEYAARRFNQYLTLQDMFDALPERPEVRTRLNEICKNLVYQNLCKERE